MIKIETGSIAVGAAMPFKSGSLFWLQKAISENTRLMLNSMVNSDVSTTPYLLQGGEDTIAGSTHTITDAAIYFNDELFLASGNSVTLSGSDVVVGTITVDNFMATNADPVTFSDSTTHNVHELRKITWSAGASGSGDFDYDDLIVVNDVWHPVTSFLDAKFSSSTIYYKRDIINNRVWLKGFINNTTDYVGGSVFEFPNGYYPVTTKHQPITIFDAASSNKYYAGFTQITPNSGATPREFQLFYDTTSGNGGSIYIDGLSFTLD